MNRAAPPYPPCLLACTKFMAPAWQEQEGYGYVMPATLVWLGESGQLDELKFRVSAQPFDAAAIEHTAQRLAVWLQTQGHPVQEIQIPPPGMHPHQKQMNSLLSLLLAFSLMAFVLSAILVATMINGLFAQQIRQIGMMKALGARTGQIAQLYLVLVLLISATAIALGLPAGIIAANVLTATIANLLNITLFSTAIPWWVFAVEVVAGLLVPLLVAGVPIVRGSRVTVRETINDYGVRQQTFGKRSFDS